MEQAAIVPAHRVSGPSTPRFQRLSTVAAPPRDRFAFWSSQFPGTDMAPVEGREARPYDATALSCAGDDGVGLTRITCDPTTSRIRQGEVDAIRLSVLTRGRVQVSHGDARAIVGPGSGLHLFDCRRGFTADAPGGHDSLHISLPRTMVLAAMGGEPIAGRDAMRMLPETPLSLVIKAKLQALLDQADVIDARECGAAMQALSGLVCAYLGSFARRDADGAEASGDPMFSAACALIDARKGSPGLTVDAVAVAMGCSRATLHRLFAGRGLSVAAYIRRVRLGHSRALLRDLQLDIGDVALRCGYNDLSAFGKAFRREFNLTPREWRMAATCGTPLQVDPV